MAAMAELHADCVILTDDNPAPRSRPGSWPTWWRVFAIPAPCRSSTPGPRQSSWHSSQASKEDIILVAGKGHEDYQIIGTDKRHYSDRETVAAALYTLMESFK